jgi:large subunit ribosomal protein L3
MPVGLLGRKIGNTQVYNEAGEIVPVTVIEAGPCVVLQVRTQDKDGYEAVQLGFDDRPVRRSGERVVSPSRAERGHVRSIKSKRQERLQQAGTELSAKANTEVKAFVREVRTDGEQHGLEVGQALTVDHLAEVARVDVIGTSKGRGFSGVMRRHNFGGQRASHGVKRVHRHAGSIGMSADPSRVLKGTRMAGQYGNARITVRNLRVVKVDAEKNLILIKGAIPGPKGGYVVVRHTTKLKQPKKAV